MKHGPLLILLTALLAATPAPPVHAGSLPPGIRSDDHAAPVKSGSQQKSYALSAAYPNPFRTRTRFDLRVKKTQEVSVEVYNLLGQRVRRLYKGTLRAGHTRTFTFKAGSLPSGLYLYRIQGDTFTAARRVTLVQ